MRKQNTNDVSGNLTAQWHWSHLCTKKHVREAAYVTARGTRAALARIAMLQDTEPLTVATAAEMSKRILELRRLTSDLLQRKDEEKVLQLTHIRVKLLERLRTLVEAAGLNPDVIRQAGE